MALTKQKKQDIVAKLKGALEGATSAVFVSFKGLTVGDASELRRALKGERVSYTVAKKTLLKRALESAGASGEMPALEGEIAVAYPSAGAGDGDVTAPARTVYEFQKKFDGRLAIAGGIFEGAYRNKEGMLEIATIPSMQTLRGMFVNLINSPIQRVVIALDQIAQKKG